MEYFILNEHSLPISREIENQCFKQFFDIYKEARNRNFKQILIFKNIEKSWYNLVISENRTILDWVTNQPRDYSRRVKSLISSIQCVELHDDDIEQFQSIVFSDFYLHNSSVPFLGAAYVLEQLAFSFDSDAIWNDSFFSLEHKELVDTDITVSNVTTKEHWDLHFAHILEERKNQALISTDFENRLNAEFPNIIFTNSASKDLRKEQFEPFLRKIWDVCRELNEVIERADSSITYQYIINETKLTITDESDTVKQNQRLKSHRMKRYKRKREFFGHHIKNFPGRRRVHFIVDEDINKIVIGYLGKHLPTSRF